MRTLDATALANIQAGASSERLMVRMDLASGSVGFWQGNDTITHGGVTFNGWGSVLEMDSFEENGELSSVSCVIRLRAIPVQFLSGDALASIEAQGYHQRPAVLSIAHMDMATGGLIAVEPIYAGRIDQITHRDDGETYTLEARLESRSRDYTITGHREQSDADQRALDSTDTGLFLSGISGKQTVYWGRKAPESAVRALRADVRRKRTLT